MKCPDPSDNYPELVEVTVSFCGKVYKIWHNTEWHKWYRWCIRGNKSIKILNAQIIINEKFDPKANPFLNSNGTSHTGRKKNNDQESYSHS